MGPYGSIWTHQHHHHHHHHARNTDFHKCVLPLYQTIGVLVGLALSLLEDNNFNNKMCPYLSLGSHRRDGVNISDLGT